MTLYILYVIVALLLILMFFILMISFLNPRKARKWFLKSFKVLFKRFCFRLKCNETTIDLENVFNRFQAFIPAQHVFFKTLEEEFHFRRVLDVLNATISEFQFSIMPSGSLREGFGKLQPSTSALASDYDMMLIPEDCFAQLSSGLQLEPTAPHVDTDTIFEAVRPPGTDTAFCWLKLRDDLSARHKHWKRFIVYKKLNGEDVPVLSNDKIRHVLRNVLESAKNDLAYLDSSLEEFKTGEVREHSYIPDIQINGPAVTINIAKKEKSSETCSTHCFSCLHTSTYMMNCMCCCGCFFPLRDTAEGREISSFYSDFTLSLCCREWPNDATEWFTRQRNWPNRDVVQKIRNSVIHIVPKPSTSLSPITFVRSQVGDDTEEDEVTPEQIYGNIQPDQLAIGFQTQVSGVKKSSGAEFRFSFSQAEAILSTEAPKQAKQVYIVFKSTIKRLQESLNLLRKYKIETFALKSIFYRSLENVDFLNWSTGVTGVRKQFLIQLFENLYALLSQRFCPHYWISTINLFEKYIGKDDDLPKTVQIKAASHRVLLTELEKLKNKMTSYVLDDWVEHNRCLMDYCCFYTNFDTSCHCLPICEIPHTHVSTNSVCCGPPPDEEENEIFAVY